MVEVANPTLSVRRQGELLGLNRSSYYYQAAPESALNLQLMRLVDEQFLRTPFYGELYMKVPQVPVRQWGARHATPKMISDPDESLFPWTCHQLLAGLMRAAEQCF